MTDEQEKIGLLEAIDVAMDAELKAKTYYTDAMTRVKNPLGKDLLKQLAQFEDTHYEKLKEFKQLLTGMDQYMHYQGTNFCDIDRKECGPGVKGDISAGRDELLEIIKIAIEAEKKATDHYAELANTTTDPKGKEMFRKLAQEEILHRRILSDQYFQIANHGAWVWGE
jgi:rubrerythrin